MKQLATMIMTTWACAALVSWAAGPDDGHASRMMAHLDSNGDGLVSMDEFQNPPTDHGPGRHLFDRADLDGDGAITQDEMATARAERQARAQAQMAEQASRMDQLFVEMDSDGDGSVTSMEMRNHAFARMDENQDGYLSAEEVRPPRGPGHGKRPPR